MALNNHQKRIAVALLVLRLTVFLVMLIWTIDKFVRPDHAASVYERFYALRGFSPTMMFFFPEILSPLRTVKPPLLRRLADAGCFK